MLNETPTISWDSFGVYINGPFTESFLRERGYNFEQGFDAAELTLQAFGYSNWTIAGKEEEVA